jgi:hypothetical protein
VEYRAIVRHVIPGKDYFFVRLCLEEGASFSGLDGGDLFVHIKQVLSDGGSDFGAGSLVKLKVRPSRPKPGKKPPHYGDSPDAFGRQLGSPGPGSPLAGREGRVGGGSGGGAGGQAGGADPGDDPAVKMEGHSVRVLRVGDSSLDGAMQYLEGVLLSAQHPRGSLGGVDASTAAVGSQRAFIVSPSGSRGRGAVVAADPSSRGPLGTLRRVATASEPFSSAVGFVRKELQRAKDVSTVGALVGKAGGIPPSQQELRGNMRRMVGRCTV